MYESKLDPQMDLNLYFTSEEYQKLELGKVSLPSGKLVAGDPLASFPYQGTAAFRQTIPVGSYPVTLSVLHTKEYGDRYLAAKMTITNEPAVRFQLALKGKERLEDLSEGEYFGFPVQTGLAGLCDARTQKAFGTFANRWFQEHPDQNLYDDCFAEEFLKSYQKAPKYQRPEGDWLDWHLPDKTGNVLMFNSGFGDGIYPCYWGYDRKGKICCIILQFISPSELEE